MLSYLIPNITKTFISYLYSCIKLLKSFAYPFCMPCFIMQNNPLKRPKQAGFTYISSICYSVSDLGSAVNAVSAIYLYYHTE